ncbi:MAG: hypothetical protein ACK57N_06705 [Planctomycetia bacterium]
MKHLNKIGICACLATLTASAARAEGVSANYNKNYGGSLLGGSVVVNTYAEAEINVEEDLHTAYADGDFRKRVKLLGGTFDVLHVEAWAEAERHAGQTAHDQNFRVSMLAGIAVWDSQDGDLALNLPTINVFPGNGQNIPVPCGPFTVKVKVNAGVDGAVNLGASADPSTGAVALFGTAQGWAQGAASASASIGGVAEVGVKAKLKLANLNANLELTPGPGAVEGTLGIALNPISIDLDAYVKLILPFVPDPKYTVNVFEWSAAQVTQTYQLN